MLSSVTYPGGTDQRRYHYENATHPDLLTGITDARGSRYATWTYDSARRVVSSEHAGGSNRNVFDYSSLAGAGTSRTTVTNPLGKQTTYYYTNVNGLQRVFHIAGHASDNCVAANRGYEYDGRAFIRSQTDWEGNRTGFLRDDRGRELVRREAEGTPEQREIHTEWHTRFNLPTRISEPGRETLFSYDTEGNLIERRVIAVP
jgi:YD repeat-containing protein